MKLTDNIEVKANKIVFDRETVYELEGKTADFPGMWCRTVSNRKTDIGVISNQKMAHNMMCVANTDRYRMRIDEKTINIYTRKYDPSQNECRCGNFGCVRHNE